MNNFEKQIQKFKELKKNGKDVYLKYRENKLSIIDYLFFDPLINVISFYRNDMLHFAVSTTSSTKLDEFEILNEEEYLKEQKKIIENRLAEIEEEKKPKIEIGKTYVIRKKGTESEISFCHVSNINDNKFFRQTPIANSWSPFSDYDFQEVDISIKEFFVNRPHNYWKN